MKTLIIIGICYLSVTLSVMFYILFAFPEISLWGIILIALQTVNYIFAGIMLYLLKAKQQDIDILKLCIRWQEETIQNLKANKK